MNIRDFVPDHDTEHASLVGYGSMLFPDAPNSLLHWLVFRSWACETKFIIQMILRSTTTAAREADVRHDDLRQYRELHRKTGYEPNMFRVIESHTQLVGRHCASPLKVIAHIQLPDLQDLIQRHFISPTCRFTWISDQ